MIARIHDKRMANELDVDTNDGYESPGVTEVNPTYDHMDLARQIRDDSRLRINKQRKIMKVTRDRLRKVNKFEIGNVVGVIVPNDYRVRESNKLPAVVIGVKKSTRKPTVVVISESEKDEAIQECEELAEDEYTLAYANNRIDTTFFQHEMIPLSGKQDYYDVVVTDTMMTVSYQLGLLKSMPLQSAYNAYISTISKHAESTDTDDDNAMNDTGLHQIDLPGDAAVNISNFDTIQAITKDKISLTDKLVLVKITDNKCKVCCDNLKDNECYDLCYNCGCKMHRKDECKFGTLQVGFENNKYCTFPCFRKQKVYEVKIIKENKKTKKYTILYSNGNISELSMEKVESIAQYVKMVYDWKKMQTDVNTTNDSNTGVDDEDELEIISATVTTNGASMKNNDKKACVTNVCCVCDEELSVDNPHNCYGCKRSMHGHIICPKRHLMYVDDDKLYCNTCKQ